MLKKYSAHVLLGLTIISGSSSFPLMACQECPKKAQVVPFKNQICDQLFSILEKAQDQDYIGEPVSQLEHALQCAYFARLSGADDEVVIAALFHDIGHLCADPTEEKMGDLGVANHDVVGAQFLMKKGLSEKIGQLVLGHVQAKRYLTYIYPEYYEKLSEASKGTLALQGGPMTLEEAMEFENDPLFNQKIQMRTWDEQAKVIDLEVPDLNTYKELVINLLNG